MYRVFRSMLMGISVDYYDQVECRNTHPIFLPRAEAGGVISKQNIKVLRQTTDADKTYTLKRKPPILLVSGNVHWVSRISQLHL